MALSLSAIHERLADVLRSNLERPVNVYPFPALGMSSPRITVEPSAEQYVSYSESFDGPASLSEVRVSLVIETVAADDASSYVQMLDYLGSGSGEGSSLVDAIATDQTLGGIVSGIMPTAARVGRLTPDGPLLGVLDLRVLAP
jgi:hypothetical protein